jgi:hypothetical protein
LIGHFLSSLWGFDLSWILFRWLVLVPHWGRGDDKQIRWESVLTRCFLAKFKQQRGLEGVALRQWAPRQGQSITKSNKSRCLKS